MAGSGDRSGRPAERPDRPGEDPAALAALGDDRVLRREFGPVLRYGHERERPAEERRAARHEEAREAEVVRIVEVSGDDRAERLADDLASPPERGGERRV